MWRQSFAGRPLMAAHCSQSRPCKICLMLGSRTYKRKSSLLGCRCFPCSHGHGSDDSHWHPTAIMSASRWRQCNPNARIAYATSLASKARYRGVRIRKTYLVTSASYTRLCACLLRVLAVSRRHVLSACFIIIGIAMFRRPIAISLGKTLYRIV